MLNEKNKIVFNHQLYIRNELHFAKHLYKSYTKNQKKKL